MNIALHTIFQYEYNKVCDFNTENRSHRKLKMKFDDKLYIYTLKTINDRPWLHKIDQLS